MHFLRYFHQPSPNAPTRRQRGQGITVAPQNTLISSRQQRAARNLRIRELADTGMTREQIADQTGVAVSTVNKVLRVLNVPTM